MEIPLQRQGKAHKGLLADRPIKTLLNYVEYDDLRHEMEWRSIAELFHYESENKQEQLKVATETTSSESHGWLHVLKNEPPHPQDPYGLSQTGRISVFSTDDISHILCPKPFYYELLKKIPDKFKECEVIAY